MTVEFVVVIKEYSHMCITGSKFKVTEKIVFF